MISSVVDLCNNALARLGESEIQGLTDETPAARQCNLFYSNTRDEVLEDHDWRAAKYYQELAQLSDTDPDYPVQVGWDFIYQLPIDPYCIMPWSATDCDGTVIQYEISGRVLMTAAETVILKYTQRILDPPSMNAQLLESIILRLASKMCLRLTSNRALKNEILQEYIGIIERARRNDATAAETQEDQTPIADLH